MWKQTLCESRTFVCGSDVNRLEALLQYAQVQLEGAQRVVAFSPQAAIRSAHFAMGILDAATELCGDVGSSELFVEGKGTATQLGEMYALEADPPYTAWVSFTCSGDEVTSREFVRFKGVGSSFVNLESLSFKILRPLPSSLGKNDSGAFDVWIRRGLKDPPTLTWALRDADIDIDGSSTEMRFGPGEITIRA